jgi:asparagine synthase (glutamine-hydrolysing)
MKNGVLKNILKQSVTGLIPQAIIDRPKQGFGLPVYELLFGKLGNYTKKVLTEFCQRTDYFNPQQVNQLLQQPSGPHTWYLLNFALWHAAYIEIK